MTHPHTDHYGGLLTLFNAFEIGETVTNGMRGEGRMFHQWEEIIRRRRIRHRVATAGDRIPGLGAISLTTLHPSVDFMNRVTDGNPNERSLVLRLDYGAFRLLLTGDIEDDGEAALIETGGDLRSVAIKVPHHGSRTSSGGGLIEVTRPEVALISVGKRNLFRHPSPEVIERYRARSAATRRTDMEGALTLTVRDRNWEVTPMLFPEDPTLLLTPSQALKSILLTGHLNGSILRRIT
jgi:competence protein ComEC